MKMKIYTNAESGHIGSVGHKKSTNVMFNFKMFCLMKKQLFSLMMVFALIVGLNVSTWAQGNTLDATSAWTDFDGYYYNDPTFMIQNSVRAFEVTVHGTNTFTWNVYTVDITTGTATAATDDTDFSLWSDAGATTSVTAGAATASQNSIYVEWLTVSAPNEVFAVDVIETNSITGSCTSHRRLYVLVYGVDMDIIASYSDGSEKTTNLLDCNIWSGDVIGNHLTADQLDDQDGSFTNHNGTVLKNKYDTIYAHVSMAGSLNDWITGSTLPGGAATSILAATGVDDFRWMFGYTISTDAGGTAFDPAADGSILSVTADEAIYFDTEDTGDNFLGTDMNNSPTLTTVLAAGDMTGTVYVPAGITEFTLTIAVHNLFNQTTSPSVSFEGANLALERSAFGGDASFNDGGESDETNNQSAVQTIYASPATPIITITD